MDYWRFYRVFLNKIYFIMRGEGVGVYFIVNIIGNMLYSNFSNGGL